MAKIRSKVKSAVHSNSGFNSWTNKIEEVVSKSIKAERERLARIKAYRIEASRLASMANKRIKRLEERDIKASPAYDRWVRDGSIKFGVKGKDYNELQKEVARMNRFLNAATSTIRGTSRVLKDMAANTNIKYDNMKQLFELAPKFFDLSDKVEEYLRVTEDAASAIGYQEIWTAINEYIQTAKIDLTSAETHISSMVEAVGKALLEKTKSPKLTIKWFIPKGQ